MKIVPVSSVKYLRSTASDDRRFPNPWEATDEQLRSVLYVAELWDDENGFVSYDMDTERIVVTFEEIRSSFADWDQSDDDCHYDNVYDYLRDCIDNGYHPCELTE